MLICIDHAQGLVVIPKAASRTIMDAIAVSGLHWAELQARDFEALPDRRAFIREPHERAASAFRMYTMSGSGHGHDLSSFDDFIADICRDHKMDPHVMPQMKLCSPKSVFLPNHIIRWDFDDLARLLRIPREAVPHRNGSWRGTKTIWSDASRALFDEVYADDLKLWRGND